MRTAVKPSRQPQADGKNGADLEALLAVVRSIWNAVDQAGDTGGAELRRDVERAIRRLKSDIDSRLMLQPAATGERTLFAADEHDEALPSKNMAITPFARFPEIGLRVYAKDLAAHALKHLPRMSRCKSIDQMRKYLLENLSFNSSATRRRNANYLIGRFFPGEVVPQDLLMFAAATAGKPALAEALFYLTCRTEKIVAMVAEEVVFPALAQGELSRSRIQEFVRTQFPESKSVKQVGNSIVSTYETLGIAKANRTRLNISLREGSLAAFAYVLHLEFPEPGMFGFEKILSGPMHKWLLWDRQWMIQQLYRLREAGLLSKVSEIDRLRQFTTKFPLPVAMRNILDVARGSEQ